MANDLTTHSKTSPLVLLSSHSRSEIAAALREPVDQAKLSRAIRDLMGLYWIAADSPEERVRQVALFVKDLAKFPEAVCVFAVNEWRTTQDRRPSIASLHQICMARQFALIDRMNYLFGEENPPKPPVDVTPEEKARREEFMARAMIAAGFVKRRTGWILRKEIDENENRPRVPHWSETRSPGDSWFDEMRRARAESPLVRGDAK